MNAVGIDIGNAFCVVAGLRESGLEVVLNEEFRRETPTCVAFGARKRFLGAAAASPAPGTSAVSQIKRLLGRPLSDPALQSDLKTFFPERPVSSDAHGYPLLHFMYRKQEVKLTPTQLLGMLLGNIKRSAERYLSAPVSECCIAVPAHFNHVQRLAVRQAAEIAGLRTLQLIHECSAAALEYGNYCQDFGVDLESCPHVTAFVDVGHTAVQVLVANLQAEELRIIAHTADPNLGGRDFDEVLFNYFAAKLKAEDAVLDVANNKRASARLRTACEKIKKVLTVNPEAPLHIECFVEDKDASGLISREEFETICHPLLQRLRLLMEKMFAKAGLEPKDVETVELIGSGSRVPAIVKMVAEVFKQEPRRSLNASECVARGCALQAAMLSPASQSEKFVVDSFCLDLLLALKD